MKSTIGEVFSAVHDERVYQDRKWGNPDQHPHEVGGYITLMRKILNDPASKTKREPNLGRAA